MALDGTAWTNQFTGLASYLEGDTPVYLTPVDANGVATGDPIAFNHDGTERSVETTEAGSIVEANLLITCRTRLVLNGRYTYDSKTWTVQALDEGDGAHHRVGTDHGVYHYLLVRHAA